MKAGGGLFPTGAGTKREPNRLRSGLRTGYAEGGRTSQGPEHCPSRFFGEFVPGPANKRFFLLRSYLFLGPADAIWLPLRSGSGWKQPPSGLHSPGPSGPSGPSPPVQSLFLRHRNQSLIQRRCNSIHQYRRSILITLRICNIVQGLFFNNLVCQIIQRRLYERIHSGDCFT